MSYTIINSDGTVLLTLADGTIDQNATSLTLIGKNVNSYGQYYNDNLVAMLENFATNGIQPRSPLVGQLWYNKSNGRLYAYTPFNTFNPVGIPAVSPSQPVAPSIGDFWIDSINKQLYFTTDGLNFTLAGPPNSINSATIRNGWYVDSIIDNASNSRLVASLYNNNSLLAVASSATFTFGTNFNGMNSTNVGITLNPAIQGNMFNGMASSALTANTVNTVSQSYVLLSSNSINQTITGPLTLQGRLQALDSNGISAGTSGEISITTLPNGYAYLSSNAQDNLLYVRVTSSLVGGYINAMVVNPNDNSANTATITFFPGSNSSQVTFAGNAVVSANLTVNGTLTNLNSTNVNIKSKILSLATGQSVPSDNFANGGGITLVGSTNHTISWTTSSGKAWQVSDNFNLISSTGTYLVGGNPVLTSSTLASGVSSAPGLTSLGTLKYLTVTNITITSSTISTTSSGAAANLYLSPVNGGTVDVLGNKITTLSTCTNPSDAANKYYVDNIFAKVGARGYAFSMDITAMSNPPRNIIGYLNAVLPITNSDSTYNLTTGTFANVLCSTSTAYIPSQPITVNQTGAVTVFDTNGVQQSVLTGVGATLPAISSTQQNPIITIAYSVLKFQILAGPSGLAWTYQGVVPVVPTN